MTSPFESILKRLQDRELILPIFENAMRADNWPESYQITVDSSPYYGTGDGYFHPSSHPLMPATCLYYLFHPTYQSQCIREPRTLQGNLTVCMGSAWHAVIQEQMVMAGLLTRDNIEVEYVNNEHHVRGRIDMLLDHPTERELMVEIKTRNSFQFGKTIEPLPSWEAQCSLALDHLGHRRGIVLMVESGFPYRTAEIRVTRNDALLDHCYGKFDLVRELIQRDGPPPRDCCGLNTPAYSKCPSRFLCFGK